MLLDDTLVSMSWYDQEAPSCEAYLRSPYES